MSIWGNNFFSQEVLPGIYANWVSKKHIAPQINAIEETEEFDYPKNKSQDIINQLKSDLKDQLERKKGLEDKIKSILFIISVSITAITFCLKDLNVTKESLLSYIVLIFLGSSILYFVAGAVLALKSLVPIAFHTPHPSLEFDSQNKKITFSVISEDVNLNELFKSKLLNDLINLKVQNKTNAILKLLRNGLIIFAAFFLTALLDKKPKPLQESKITIPVEIKLDSLGSTHVKVGLRDSIHAFKTIKKIALPQKTKTTPRRDSIKKTKK